MTFMIFFRKNADYDPIAMVAMVDLQEGKDARQGPWTPAGAEHASDACQNYIIIIIL